MQHFHGGASHGGRGRGRGRGRSGGQGYSHDHDYSTGGAGRGAWYGPGAGGAGGYNEGYGGVQGGGRGRGKSFSRVSHSPIIQEEESISDQAFHQPPPGAPVDPDIQHLVSDLVHQNNISAEQANSTMWSLAKNGDVLQVQQLLQFMTMNNIPLETNTHNAILQCFVNASNLSAFQEHWNAILSNPSFQPDATTFAIALDAYGKAKRVSQMDKVFQQMLSYGIRPNSACFAAIISGLIHCDRQDKLMQYRLIMRDCGVFLPLRTYNQLIDFYGKIGDLSTMQGVYKEVHRAGLFPNNITLNTMLYVYGKLERFDEMENFFQHCVQQLQVSPDGTSYNTLIDAYSRCGRVPEMEAHFEEMFAAGYEPDIRTYNSLFSAYSKTNNTPRLMEMVHQFERTGIHPNTGTYNILVNTFGKRGDLKTMEAFYQQLLLRGLKPDIFTFNTRLAAFGKAANEAQVLQAWEDIKKYHLTPNTSTYQNLIEAFSRLGNLKAMEDIYNEAVKNKCQLSVWAYTSLLTGYCNAKDVKNVEWTWERMKKNRVHPNVMCFNAIIKVYAEMGNVENMQRYFQQLQVSPGNRPDVHTYIQLMKGYAKVKEVDQILEIYRCLQGSRISMEEELFHELILCIAECGASEKLEDVWKDIQERFKTPALIASYLEALAMLGKADKARALWTDCVQKGLRFSDEEMESVKNALNQLGIKL